MSHIDRCLTFINKWQQQRWRWQWQRWGLGDEGRGSRCRCISSPRYIFYTIFYISYTTLMFYRYHNNEELPPPPLPPQHFKQPQNSHDNENENYNEEGDEGRGSRSNRLETHLHLEPMLLFYFLLPFIIYSTNINLHLDRLCTHSVTTKPPWHITVGPMHLDGLPYHPTLPSTQWWPAEEERGVEGALVITSPKQTMVLAIVQGLEMCWWTGSTSGT